MARDANTILGGALTFKSGLVWAGLHSLFESVDSGQTWIPTNFPAKPSDYITDIYFLDSRFGLVSTEGFYSTNGLYLTTDGGLSWSEIIASTPMSDHGMVAAAFGSLQNKIVAIDEGIVVQSEDQGNSWTPKGTFTISGGSVVPSGLAQSSALCTRGHKAYTANIDMPWTNLYFSTDDGRSWKTKSFGVQNDCYSLALDSCASPRLYLVNENCFGYYAHEGDSTGQVYITDDEGSSWQVALKLPQGQLAGGISLGRRAAYVTTATNGVLRSLDHGASWTSIKGPKSWWDCHGICAIDDNVLIGVDLDGSLYRTTNSGGSWVTASTNPTAYAFDPPLLFDLDTIVACDTVLRLGAGFTSNSCDDLAVTSQGITGADADKFSIATRMPDHVTGLDSVLIAFHPDSARDYNATYIATIGGQTVALELRGHAVNHKLLAFTEPSLNFDTVYACDPVSIKPLILKSKSCSLWKIDSISLSGADSSRFSILQKPTYLTGLDTLYVAMRADSNQDYNASLTLHMNGGVSESLQLHGLAIEPVLTVSAPIANFSTRIIGDEIIVPLQILKPGLIDFFSTYLHFDTSSLVFESASYPNGDPLGTVGNTRSGLLKLELKGTELNSALTKIQLRFLIYPGRDSCGIVALDSVVLAGGFSKCGAALGKSAKIQICGPAACGSEQLSDQLRYSAFTFSVAPNPARKEIRLTFKDLSSSVEIQLCDLIGNTLARKTSPSSEDLAFLTLTRIPSGTYYVRASSNGRVQTRRVEVAP